MAGWFPENRTETLFWTLTVINAIEVVLFVIWSSLIAAMIADIVEESELKTGRRSEGTFFAANSFASKAVNGFGVIVAGQILTAVNFPTQAKPGEIPISILYDLALIYIPTIVFFYIAAVFALSFYQINREDHSENLRKLSETR